MSAVIDAPDRTPVRPRRLVVVLVAVGVALVANLALYGLGRMLGRSFAFTGPAGPAEVDAAPVAGFTLMPLLVGLLLAALLSVRWPRVLSVAMVVAPVLALGTVPVMTLPVDLDGVSTAALALCHLVLAPVSVLALRALRRLCEGATA